MAAWQWAAVFSLACVGPPSCKVQNLPAAEFAPPLASASAQQQDFYYVVDSLDKLELDQAIPDIDLTQLNWRIYQQRRFFEPRIVLDQPGEAYCETVFGGGVTDFNADLAIHVHQPGDVTGTIFLPADDFKSEVAIRFKLSVNGLTQQPRRFQSVKAAHYQRLAATDMPGTAWFRAQRQAALAAAGGRDVETAQRAELRQRSFDDTFEMFSGGRAISENLALDQQLFVSDDEAEPYEVNLSDIAGITIREYDWTELNEGIAPKLDPLAAYIPFDQHAVIFPTFSSLLQAIDTADELGTAAIFSMEPRAEDVHTKDRYRKQLCLETSGLSRILGLSIIRSVAVTGSDPYLRTGSDVAVLFEAENPVTLTTYIRGKHAAAMEEFENVSELSGTIDGLDYEGVASADRSVCSFMARIDDVILVTNSIVQIRHAATIANGDLETLSDLDEYAFMRNRYPIGANDETAFLMLSDATIRRWCGPKWRIANSRRTRAAAVLSQTTAEFHDELERGVPFAERLNPVAGLGRITVTEAGPHSPVYNTLGFMRPIAELDFQRVTKREEDAYTRWRDGYQNLWRRSYDPIGAQVTLSSELLAGDVTIMPLIAGSEYRSLSSFAGDGKLPSAGADRHDSALLQFAIGISSEVREEARRAAQMVDPQAELELGASITVYVDDDPEFWEAIKKIDLAEIPPLRELPDPPVVLRADVKQGTNALRELESGLFGDRAGERREYRGQEIVEHDLGGLIDFNYFGVCAMPEAAFVSFNPQSLEAAIDREIARMEGTPVATSKPEWIGDHVGVQIDERGWDVIEKLITREALFQVQALSWANLPILNEWKTRYPDRDPVEVHEEIWGARLLCPAGGEYVWNEKWHTMESTAMGHPGAQKIPDLSGVNPLSQFAGGNFGLTFEDDGLRARVQLPRKK